VRRFTLGTLNRTDVDFDERTGKVYSTGRSQSDVNVQFSNSRNGEENPKWRSQVRLHSNASTPFTCTDMKPPKASPASTEVVSQTGTPFRLRRTSWRGPLLYRQVPTLTNGNQGQALAVQKFVRKANREIRSIQGLVSLGELNETLRMIRSPASALREAMRSYLRDVPRKTKRRFDLRYVVDRDLAPRGLVLPRKGGPRRVPVPASRAWHEALSGTYLEYANGWRPMLQDLDGAMRTLAEHFTPSGESYRRIVATASQPDVTFTSTVPRSVDSAWWLQTTTETRKGSTRVVGEVRVTRDGSAASFRTSAGLNLKQFVPTAWQLLPLTYVVDWFTNIGDALEVWAFNWGSVSWGCMTRKYESIVVSSGAWDQKWATNPSILSFSGSFGSLEERVVKLNRVPSIPVNVDIMFSLPAGHLASKLFNATSLWVESRRASTDLLRYMRM